MPGDTNGPKHSPDFLRNPARLKTVYKVSHEPEQKKLVSVATSILNWS